MAAMFGVKLGDVSDAFVEQMSNRKNLNDEGCACMHAASLRLLLLMTAMAEFVWLVNMGIYFILVSSCIQTVWGYYCEWDLCGSDQYCCGDNLCCEYVYSLWYFWVGILFVVILLSACGGLFRYCYYHSPQLVIHQVTSYVPLPNMGAADDGSHLLITDNHGSFHSYSAKKSPGYFPPQGPPPPYSATISPHTGHSKHNTDGSLSIYP